MKRLLTMLLMAVGFTLTATGANIFTISSAEGHPGEEVTVSVALDNSDDVVVAELQIPMSDRMKYVDGSCVLNAARSDGHQVTAGMKDGALHIVVFTVDLKPIKGSSGELLSFKLQLKKEPQTYPLTGESVVADAAGVRLESSVRAGAVTILSPKLIVETKSTDYGHIPIRGTYTRNVTVHNAGNEVLEVSDMEFSAAEFSANETAFAVQPGERRNVTITYAPVIRGAISEKVTFISNAINGKQSAMLVADPFSVNELHVGSASGICDEEVTIALTMNNMEPIVGVQCEFALPEQLVYVTDSFKASQLAGELTATSSVADGRLKLILYSLSGTEIAENDGEIATFKVRLNGKTGRYSLKPENVVLSNATVENMTSATSSGTVEIKSPVVSCASTINMGDCAVTEISTAKISISNNGDAALKIERVAFLAEGYSIAEQLPISIDSRKSAEITVQYAPTEKGEHSTLMNIYTNDPQNRAKQVEVSGYIYEPNSVELSGESTDNGYDLSVSLNNYSEIVALQMDVHWLKEMTVLADGIKLSSRLSGLSSSVSKVGEGVYRVVIFSLTNTPISGHDGEIFTLSYLDEGAEEINNSVISVDNLVFSTNDSENVASQTELTYSVKILLHGDINSDGKVNVTDIVALYSYILGNTEGVDEAVADLNDDGKVNVTDIVSLYSIILNSN